MNWNRIISGLVAVTYLGAAFAHDGAELAFKVGLFLLFPLACIWFADAMGAYTGPTTSMAITSKSPGVIVCILGWVLLLMPMFMAIVYAVFNAGG